MRKYIIFLVFAGFVSSCGLSQNEKEVARKHFIGIAEQKCACDKIKATKGHKPETFSECVREYETKVKAMKLFFEVVQPSDSERKSAGVAGDEITRNCKP